MKSLEVEIAKYLSRQNLIQKRKYGHKDNSWGRAFSRKENKVISKSYISRIRNSTFVINSDYGSVIESVEKMESIKGCDILYSNNGKVSAISFNPLCDGNRALIEKR